MGSNPVVKLLARTLGALLVVSGMGCAMLVTGVVRDRGTGDPIGGAVLSADDGRNRLAVTGPHGRFSVKTDKRPMNLIVSAPSYQTTTVAVPGDSRSPIVDVGLQQASRSRTEEALVKPANQGFETAPTEQRTDDGAAAKFKQLQDLHDRGLISDEEYQQTRRRIIGGL